MVAAVGAAPNVSVVQPVGLFIRWIAITYPPVFVPAESRTMILWLPVLLSPQVWSVAVVGPQGVVPLGRTSSWDGKNDAPEVFTTRTREIGRAACRERVQISVVA